MEKRKYIRIILNIVIPLLTIYVVCIWGTKLLVFFMPFVIGWIVSMIANPLVHYLEKHVKIVRKLSSVVLIVGVLALVITGLYLLIGLLFRELSGFISELPDLYGAANGEINTAVDNISGLFRFLPAEMRAYIKQFTDNMGAYIGDAVQKVAANAGGAVARSLPDVLVYLVVMLLSSYFFLADHDKLVMKIKERMPEPVKRYGAMVKNDVLKAVSGYFLAQFKIMFVVAVVILVGLTILGVKYSILLAIGIALLDFLPMFGTGTALIPWAVVKVFTGEYAYAVGLLLLYVLSQAIRQLIQPKIVGDSLGLPPLTTLFFLFLGYKFRGLAGMILAVPVGMIVIRFYEYGAFDRLIRNVKLLITEIENLRKE